MERSENASPIDHITTPTGSNQMSVKDTSVFQTHSAVVVHATVLANDVTNNIQLFSYYDM